MADFNTSYKIVKANEGGYANNPSDRGGETYKGIARRIFPAWSGWAAVDAGKAKPGFPGNLEPNEDLQRLVRMFYKSEFWNRLNLDLVHHQAIATELFDTAVNQGSGTAALYLQRSLNVLNRQGKDYSDLPLTGNVGPMTLAALNNHKSPGNVLKALNILQGAKYFAIAEANKSQEIFMSGWFSRVAL